jgi:hypothetical protein
MMSPVNIYISLETSRGRKRRAGTHGDMTQTYGTMDDTDCQTRERSTVKEVYCSKFCSSKRRAGVSFLLLRISSPDDGVPSHSHSIICISSHVSNGA